MKNVYKHYHHNVGWRKTTSSLTSFCFNFNFICVVPSRALPPSFSACRKSSWWGPTVWVHLPSHKGLSAVISLWSLPRVDGCPSPYPCDNDKHIITQSLMGNKMPLFLPWPYELHSYMNFTGNNYDKCGRVSGFSSDCSFLDNKHSLFFSPLSSIS